MIDAETFRQYCDSVRALTDAVSEGVEREVLAWCQGHPDASAAEAREYSKSVMGAWAETYDDAAATLAAEFYDATVGGQARLPSAITESVYDPAKTDDVARYQVKKLMAGDVVGFARACGEYAANDAKRALNRTIMRNVERDRSRGARFARILTGRENCPFCIMLASRGAVYHSRHSAGEFAHFHRNCDCKVVAGLADDPMATIVEGHDPLDCRRVYERIISADVRHGLYEGGRAELNSEVNDLERQFKDAWMEFKQSPGTSSDYQQTVGRMINSLSRHGRIEIEDFTARLEGKELQEIKWLADAGLDVSVRNPNDHARASGGNTSDLLVNGEFWDLKRVTSSNPNKIAQAMLRKKRQGPNFVIDLTQSDISKDAAVAKVAWMLDDDRVGKVAIIKGGELILMK